MAQGFRCLSLHEYVLIPLSAHWQRHVIEASGYIELGMLEQAAEALAKIRQEDEGRDEVRRVRLDLYMAGKQWDLAASIATQLLKADPNDPATWVNLAYSTRRAQGLKEAEAILLRAREVHPDHALIAYNLACYASAAGRLEEAKERLQHAFNLDKNLRAMAVEDPDFRPLWNWIDRLEE
jgi:tetratricopeptide (TPR) repeat protein